MHSVSYLDTKFHPFSFGGGIYWRIKSNLLVISPHHGWEPAYKFEIRLMYTCWIIRIFLSTVLVGRSRLSQIQLLPCQNYSGINFKLYHPMQIKLDSLYFSYPNHMNKERATKWGYEKIIYFQKFQSDEINRILSQAWITQWLNDRCVPPFARSYNKCRFSIWYDGTFHKGLGITLPSSASKHWIIWEKNFE